MSNYNQRQIEAVERNIKFVEERIKRIEEKAKSKHLNACEEATLAFDKITIVIFKQDLINKRLAQKWLNRIKKRMKELINKK